MGGNSLGYRSSVERAVEVFRPVLRALHIREQEKHTTIRLAQFSQLELLDLDGWSISVRAIDLSEENCYGMFSVQIEPGNDKRVKCFIFIKKSLFDSLSDKEAGERIKIIGVHEFCHFLALLYAMTALSIDRARDILLARLKKKTDSLNKKDLEEFERVFVEKNFNEYYDLLGFNDAHYRLDCEGDSPNYQELFLYFLFSRELLETDFTKEKQKKFRDLVKSGRMKEAASLLSVSITKMVSEKWVKHEIAVHQVQKWLSVYVR
ncbi:MAG: hypothetical protein LBT00_05895 [Spirochaetaceae bacterium]|jgi:hypothetical protein|nr:hypothetical protein [Spirochaetaceae bacterium]